MDDDDDDDDSRKKKKKKPAADHDCQKYLKLLCDNVQTRTFSLSDIPQSQVVSTGRTIQKMKAWNGIWPAMRELLQNTIDHLHLMDRSGRRRTCLDMSVSTKTTAANHNNDSTTTTTTTTHNNNNTLISLACGTHDICQFHVSPNEIIIDQWYTYPIASRALDTGVPDTTKQQQQQSSSSSSQQAGGFGDGFKTAAVALLANNKDDPQLTWQFYVPNEKTRIQWRFQGETREKIATFAKCQVLQVEITKHPLDKTEFQNTFPSSPAEQSYVMRQCIQVKGIGPRFVSEVLPKFTVFWDFDESSLLSTARGGGDCLGPVAAQPPLFRGMLGNNFRPASGIYVRGIWVRPSKIKDTIMSFHGNRLEVTGRDRNEVDDDQLVEAVAYVMQRCHNNKNNNNPSYLKKLLDPLRGTTTCTMEPTTNSSSSSSRNNNKKKMKNKNKSWLLQSPRFFNRVIELQKDFILQRVFEFPKGAIFVSSKTTNSKDAFISWAATFLKNHGTPLVPIDEKGAHKYLFEEVQKWELMDRCVAILKKRNYISSNKTKRKNTTTAAGDSNQQQQQALFRKLVAFLGIGSKVKLFVSSQVAIAFCHNSDIFIPECCCSSSSSVTRELIVKVLNVCHSHYCLGAGNDAAERYSCLMQAIFELLPSSTSTSSSTGAGGTISIIRMDDVAKLINRAKEIGKENETFLSGGGGGGSISNIDHREEEEQKKKKASNNNIMVETRNNNNNTIIPDSRKNKKRPHRMIDNINNKTFDDAIDLTACSDDGEEEVIDNNNSLLMERNNNNNNDHDLLEQQIERVRPAAASVGQDDADDEIIPNSNFADDHADDDGCCMMMRASSNLQKVSSWIGGSSSLYCDSRTAAAIQGNNGEKWNHTTRVLQLHRHLQQAIAVIRHSIPSLTTLLNRVYAGYDGQNDTYEGFCNNDIILINLFAFMDKHKHRRHDDSSSCLLLLYDFVVVVTHELAHYLEPSAGHGPVWRDTHSRMLVRVMHHLEPKQKNKTDNK